MRRLADIGSLTLDELQRLSWLRGRVEAECFCAYKTADHDGWLCDSQTAARLSFFRWLFITQQLTDNVSRA